MFAFKVATILTAAAMAFAHPAIHARGEGSCSTGTLQCCDSIAPAGSTSAASLLGAIPLNLQNTNVPVGTNCLPVNVIAGGTSGTCSAQAACCNGMSHTGSMPIGIDCSPMNAGF